MLPTVGKTDKPPKNKNKKIFKLTSQWNYKLMLSFPPHLLNQGTGSVSYK